ncbi:MAG: dihydropteroate synthase [Candidatus Baltobacteraceae bacterium]
MQLRGRDLRWGERTYVMGIVNVTPDSFSGDGIEEAQAAAAFAVRQAQGADIVDIGAESTRPGHAPVDEAAELQRLLPVLRAVRAQLPDVVISVDTHKPAVFEAAHAHGADILNSIWGLPEPLLASAARAGVPVVVMHNQTGTSYAGRVIDEVKRFLLEAAHRALHAGISRERIVLDPGIGFGKTPDQNIEVLRDLRAITALGFPTLIGTSRKSTIGKLTGKAPPQRVFGTAATTALAVAAGIDIVRVHDVDAALDAVHVSDAIVRNWRPQEWMS